MSSLIPIILGATLYLLVTYVFVLNGRTGSASLTYTEPCGNGDYRLFEYRYNNGDGYLALVDRQGKVLDKSPFSEGADIGPFRWKKNCTVVNVGTGGDRVDLMAK